MRKTICTMFALPLFLSCNAGAADVNNRLRACLEMQGKAPSEQALECYNRAAKDQLAARDIPKGYDGEMHAYSLAGEWAPSDQLLRIYRQNYFLFYSHSSQPNNAPTSPNPDNQVPPTYPLDSKEMKFQISIKGRILGEDLHTLWFGYTQLSFWQIYDGGHSNPFRESNYEPELIYSYRPQNWDLAGVTTSFLNVGIYVHQSNGQSQPRSRGWNRSYLQAGLERDLGKNRKLVLIPRWWKRWGGGGIDDDNPDITRYLGHGDLEIRYHQDQGILSALVRRHSLQLDLALPLSLLTAMLQNTNLHLQYFDGYGESLIDYNQRHRTLGVGISMPLI